MVWEDPQCSALGHGSRKRCPPVVNPVTQTQATLPGEPLRTQDGQGALHLPHRESEGGVRKYPVEAKLIHLGFFFDEEGT